MLYRPYHVDEGSTADLRVGAFQEEPQQVHEDLTKLKKALRRSARANSFTTPLWGAWKSLEATLLERLVGLVVAKLGDVPGPEALKN